MEMEKNEEREENRGSGRETPPAAEGISMIDDEFKIVVSRDFEVF